MYLHIGNNVMLPEKHIIGVFDLEIKDADDVLFWQHDIVADVQVHGTSSVFAPKGRGVMRRARRSTTPPIFFPWKENGRCDRPKERRLIVSLDFE